MADENGQQQAANTDTAPDNSGKQQQAASTSEAKFTQEDVNRIAGETRKHGAESALKALLESLGVADVDTLKAKLEAEQQREEASKTEAQKAADAAAKERARAEKAEADLKAEREARVTDKRNLAITAAAQKARAEHPEDVLRWAMTDAPDQLAKVLKEDGAIDDKAINDLIEACRTKRKAWFGGGTPGSPSNSGGTLSAPNKPDLDNARNTLKQVVRKAF